MQSCLTSKPVEAVNAEISIVAKAPTSLLQNHVERLCFDGVCSIDSGFTALLRNSKGRLTVASTEEARSFDFVHSPRLA